MRFVIFSLAATVLVAALVMLVGRLLPATREGRAEAVIAAPPDRVIATIMDVERQPEWRDVRSVTRTGDGWVEVTSRGERIIFVPETLTETAIQLLFFSDAGYAGEWETVIAPVPDGTRIAVTERATIPSPVGRIIARVMFDPDAFAAAYLVALKARVEG